MKSISDYLRKLGRMRACMQNILIFLVIFRAKCSIFWLFIKNLRNNYQITEKIN